MTNLRHIVVGLIAVFAVGLNWVAFSQSAAQTGNRAGLVVRYGDGSAQTACVSFNEEAISGYDLLRRSNIPVIADLGNNMGAFVCKIGSDGCNFPQEDCACKFNSEQKYWSYWLLQNSAWQYSNVGAGNASVSNGSVQGWVWNTGSANTEANTKPPVLTLEQICSAASATTPTQTSTATATATATPLPTPQPPTLTATYTPVSTPVPVANVIGGGQAVTSIAPQPSSTNAALISIAPTQPSQQPTPNTQTQAVVVGVAIATHTPAPLAPPTLTSLPTPSPTSTMLLVLTPKAVAPATSLPEPTLTATSSPAPTAPSAQIPTPSHTPTPSATAMPPQAPSPLPTPTPVITNTPQPATNVLGYALFGLMALGLASGIVLLRVRK